MQRSGPNRGTQPAIPAALWAQIQQLEFAGKKLAEIRDWLLVEHGIKVDKATVCRTMKKIRAAAPPPPLDLGLESEPEPADDKDELARMRKRFRREMETEGTARDRQGAARLVMQIMEAQRELNKPKETGAGAAAGDAAPAWAPPTFGVKGPN